MYNGKYILKYIFMTTTGLILTLGLLPLFLPIIFLLWINWLCAKVLIKIKYKGKATMVTGTDVVHGKESRESMPVNNVAVRVKGKIHLDKIRAKVENTLLNTYDDRGLRTYRRMTEVYTTAFGYYIYKDAQNFDIKNHIYVVKWEDIMASSYLEKKINPDCWEDSVKLILKALGDKRFPEMLPQWQILLIEDAPERYTALFRLHHAISDGISLLRMFGEEFIDHPIKLFPSFHPPPSYVKFFTNLWSFCLLPFGIMKVALHNDRNALHGPKLTGKKSYFVTRPIRVKTLQEMKTRIDVSFNAILFSCVSYAVASHFSRKSSNVTKLTALTTVPLRNPSKPNKLTNKFAVGSMKLPVPHPDLEYVKEMTPYTRLDTQTRCCEHLPLTAKNSNPISRLKAVQKTLLECKQDPSLVAANFIVTLICALCPAKLAESIISVKGCTLCISNVPGPQEQLHLWSGQQEEMMFWIPDRTPIGAGFSFMSYNGYLRAGLAMDHALLESDSEGDQILRDFEDEVQHILTEIEEAENKNIRTKKDGCTLQVV